MIYKRYSLFCFLLLAGTILPIVNEREFSLMPSVMAQSVDTEKAEADKLLQQGIQQFQVSQFREALQSWEKALKIYREIKNRQGEAVSLGNLGNAYHSLGQYKKAIDYHQESLKIKEEFKEKEIDCQDPLIRMILCPFLTISGGTTQNSISQGVAASFVSLGNAYYALGQYEKAIEYYKLSLDLSKKINDRQGEANSLGNLGVVYQSLGQYKKAIDYHQQSLDIKKEISDRQGEVASLGNLGNAYYSLEQYQKAIEYYKLSLDLSKKIDDRQGEANSLNNSGEVYQSLGQYEKAIHYYQQSLDIKKNIGDRQGIAHSLGGLGLAYKSLGQYQKAIEYYQQSLTITKEIGDRSGEAFSLNNLGVTYRDNKQPEEAIKKLEESLHIILEMRGSLSRNNRKDFLVANEDTVIFLADLLIQQKQTEKAFEWLNLFTTADLSDYNRLINAKVANPEAQKEIDNWKASNQQLEGMRQRLQEKFSDDSAIQMREFEAKVNQEAESIAQKYPEVAELFETKPTDIAKLQQNIAPDTLVIQPFPLRDKIALFLLTKNKLTVIESNIKADKFNQLVNQYRHQISDRTNADYLVTSSQLYDILIRPIEQQIKTNSPKNLAIIATDQLRYIPFESLYDSKTEQYLLQKYPISYLTRISTANNPNSPSKTAKNLNALALANPKPTNRELKGTEKEAENLLKIFPKSETYLGEKATLDTFKTQASRFSILHLGTHGCFNPDGCPDLKMEANTILFANNQKYNIADAALLGLINTELINLSACRTATEAQLNGIEIVGSAYIFERAGAKSVIASLWDAEDNTSAEIMIQFYQNLQKGMTKSEAMQKAKLSQIEKNKDLHPFFWSPFILIGDAQ